MMTLELAGIIPPVITPFDADENYSPGAMQEILDRLIEGGVHAVFVVGSVSEFYSLRMEEIKEVIRTSVRAVDGRVPVLAGTGAIATRDAIELSRYAEDVGADGLSILTPFFIQLDEDELFQHYAAVAQAVKIPVLGYANPARAGGMTLSARLMKRLSGEFENVIGIKYSSNDFASLLEYKAACPPAFKVFTGLDTVIFDAVVNDCAGAVPGLANLVPALAVSVYEHTRAGRLKEAREAQSKFAPLRAAYSLGSFPSVLKEAAHMLGLPAGPTRRPIQPLTPEARSRLRGILVEVLGEDALPVA
jgi:4-hydroxy-tetrahydrodipicolinate synthase